MASGQFRFFTAPSGTAGNVVSYTQAMTLDASGNLSVASTGGVNQMSLAANGTSTYANVRVTNSSSTAALSMGVGGSAVGASALQNNAYIWNTAASALSFGTSDTERARITSGGNFLAGLTTPINGHGFKSSGGVDSYRTTSTAGDGVHHFYSDYTSTQNLIAAFRGDGGLANYSANNVNLSDERVKTDIKPVGSYWDKFKAIEIVTFKYKGQSHEDDNIGVIAQQVEAVAPEFIDVDGFGETPEDGVPLKTVYTTDLYHASIKALQEAMARIESLEARLAALEN